VKKFVACVALLMFALVSYVQADDAKLKGLWTTGGCCHDYKKHAPLLAEKIGQYANVKFDIVFGLDQFKNKDYAKDYDVVVYDLCEAGVKDKELIGNIIETIAEGKPAIIIHCSLHTFRGIDWDDWRKAMGMTSRSHDIFRALKTKKKGKVVVRDDMVTGDKKKGTREVEVQSHPTTKFWPEDWETPGDELYQTIKLWPTATALMAVESPQSDEDHIVTWVNQLGDGKVFATTLGHNMLTVGQDDYHHLLANGVLWVCGKLGDDGKPAKGYEGTGKK